MYTAPSAKRPTVGPTSHYVRWKFDPNATDLHVEPTELVNLEGEMPHVDSRYATKQYNYVFLAMTDPTKPRPVAGGMYNAISKCNINDGTYQYWSAGETVSLHEVAFVPRSPEG